MKIKKFFERLPEDILPQTASFPMLRMKSVIGFTVLLENTRGAAFWSEEFSCHFSPGPLCRFWTQLIKFFKEHAVEILSQIKFLCDLESSF